MRAGIFTVTVENIQDMGIQDTRHFRMVFDPGTVFDFEAGQFLNIMVPTPEKVIKRPYSIASSCNWKGSVDLCVKKVPGGKATEYLWSIKQGDRIQIQGPLGRFTARRPLPKTIVFVSTGTGIAPFRSMIHDLLEKGETLQIWNIFGNRYDEDILYQKEFEDLAAKHPNLKNVFTVSRPKTWKGETKYVQFMLQKYIPSPADTHVYICGLTSMINAVVEAAAAMGFTKEQIFFEKYD